MITSTGRDMSRPVDVCVFVQLVLHFITMMLVSYEHQCYDKSTIVTVQSPDSCRLRRRAGRREGIWGHPRPRQEDCAPLHSLLNSKEGRELGTPQTPAGGLRLPALPA